MKQPFTASVVGGGFGGRLSLTALRNSNCFSTLAAADLRPDVRTALESEFPGVRTFETHEQMFADCPADVVCVSTYPTSHEAVVMDALNQPGLKGLLVEKPLGDTAESGKRILDAIRSRNLPVVVPHGLRVRATPLEIVSRVRRGEIGDLHQIEVQCDKWDLLNAGIHWLDFCLAASGESPIEYVLAACDTSTRTYRDGIQVETEAITYVVNRDGVRFIVQTGDYVRIKADGKSCLFRLVGSKGVIEFWGWESGFRILNSDHPSGDLIVPEDFPETAHQRHLESLVRQIETGAPDYTLPASSLTALEICQAAFVSGRNSCMVRFPLSSFTPPGDSGWVWGLPYSGTGGGRDGRTLG